MKRMNGAGTCGAPLHRCCSWRVAGSFSCLGLLATFSISISGMFSICRIDALTLDAEGQVVILWSDFPHMHIGCSHVVSLLPQVLVYHWALVTDHVGRVVVGYSVN